jgi:ribosomal protein L29
LLRMKKFSAPEKNTALTRNLRKALARTLTILTQREAHENN